MQNNNRILHFFLILCFQHFPYVQSANIKSHWNQQLLSINNCAALGEEAASWFASLCLLAFHTLTRVWGNLTAPRLHSALFPAATRVCTVTFNRGSCQELISEPFGGLWDHWTWVAELLYVSYLQYLLLCLWHVLGKIISCLLIPAD